MHRYMDWNKNEFYFSELEGKTIFITGATGLIGSNLVHSLVSKNKYISKPIRIIAFVRNITKAQTIFKNDYNQIEFLVGDVTKPIHVMDNIDYIVHAASQTSSRTFVNQPLNTIKVAVDGTVNVLELAKEKAVKKVVYLSTMEVYGAPSTDEKITEQFGTNLDTTSVRSCYPESKRLCENLCVSYMKQFGIPVNIVRLTQTFGRGVAYKDNRVFAEFARCVIEKKDIVLHTKGETKRSYLYTQDAVNAILTVMINGENGQAYNAANEMTYCSIYEMAQMVAYKCANGEINVKIEVDDESKFGFAPVLRMNLDTSKLQSIGWKAEVGLEEMFHILIDDMRTNRI